MKKVVYISSAGGHLSELLQLHNLFKYYKSYLITEKDYSTLNINHDDLLSISYLISAKRDNILLFLLKNILNILISLFLFIKIYPDVVISTGANTSVPLCYFSRLFGKKIIFIETFALSHSKTLSGRLVYPIADVFLVQWESLLELYPKAKYIGGLF